MIQTSKFLQLMLPLKSIELLIFLGRGDILAISGSRSKLQLQSELDFIAPRCCTFILQFLVT